MRNGVSPIISVINPNSNEAVTRGLEEALSCLSFKEGPQITCSTLAEGPFGIETQADADDVVAPLRRLVEKDNASSAFVIACYSDPGLHSCREASSRPVFGIAECAVLTALARMIAVGEKLRDLDGAQAVVMGCAGMARHRRPLEDALGVPVIDPTQAAVAMAIGTLAAG